MHARHPVVRGRWADPRVAENMGATQGVQVAQLGEWGLRHRPTTKRLRVRAEVLAAGGPPLWAELMAELRAIHLGTAAPERTSPSVIERLAEAYAAAS